MKQEPYAATLIWNYEGRTCTVSIPLPKVHEVPDAIMVWTPDRPPEMSASELRAYLKARNVALAAASKAAGIDLVVLDYDRPPASSAMTKPTLSEAGSLERSA